MSIFKIDELGHLQVEKVEDLHGTERLKSMASNYDSDFRRLILSDKTIEGEEKEIICQTNAYTRKIFFIISFDTHHHHCNWYSNTLQEALDIFYGLSQPLVLLGNEKENI